MFLFGKIIQHLVSNPLMYPYILSLFISSKNWKRNTATKIQFCLSQSEDTNTLTFNYLF